MLIILVLYCPTLFSITEADVHFWMSGFTGTLESQQNEKLVEFGISVLSSQRLVLVTGRLPMTAWLLVDFVPVMASISFQVKIADQTITFKMIFPKALFPKNLPKSQRYLLWCHIMERRGWCLCNSLQVFNKKKGENNQNNKWKR